MASRFEGRQPGARVPRAAELWLLSICLGACGFALNGAPLAISPGVDVVLGGALVFAGFRLLSRAQFALAFSIAAIRTIFLWSHPWAWLIWTLEGLVLAARRKGSSPVIFDICYWISGGSLLIWLTYGQIMQMDALSLQLTILKQAINAVLNVVIGEIIYIAGSYALRSRLRHWAPQVSAGSIILPFLVTAVAMPAVILMRIEAPSWDKALRKSADLRLTDNLDENKRKMAELHMQAEEGLAPAAGSSSRGASASFLSEVLYLQVAEAAELRGELSSRQSGRVRLIGEAAAGALFVEPVLASSTTAGSWVFGKFKPGVIQSQLAPAKINSDDSIVLLVDRENRIAGSSTEELPDRDILQQLAGVPPGELVVIRPPRRFGVSLMNRTRETSFVRAAPIAEFPGWKLVTATGARTEILDQRYAQVRMLAALAVAIAGMALLSGYISQVLLRRLRLVARSVSEFAVHGTDQETIQSVMVTELAEILTSVARTGQLVSSEREFLLTNRRRLESIARYAPVIIFSFEKGCDVDGALSYVSQNVERLLGFTTDEALSPGWWHAHLHPEDHLLPADTLRPSVPTTKEYRLRHKDGHYVWIYECMAISEDHPGEVVGVMIDISDRKKIAEQLGFTSKMESLGRIAAGIAHELNQPLQVIRLAAQNAELRLQVGDAGIDGALEKLAVIKGQIDRAAKIVRQVNAFGKPTESKIRPVVLKELLESTFALLQMQISDDEVQLGWEELDPTIVVSVDAQRLEQVVVNLVQNARHAIGQRKDGYASGLIVAGVRRANKGVIIWIEDNGTGIDAADLPFLFEPFFTTKAESGGTGLGLSVSYSIINEMGGRIWAENTGHGARFSIWFEESSLQDDMEAMSSMQGRAVTTTPGKPQSTPEVAH